MSCWIYPFSTAGTQIAVCLGYSADVWCADWMGIKNGVGYFYTGPNGTLGRENEVGTIYAKRWNHIAHRCSYISTDYDEHDYWVNGVNVDARGMDNDPRTAPDRFRIGLNHTGSNPFNGLIANVHIWTRSLKNKEVVDDMFRPRPTPQGLWASFPLIASPFSCAKGRVLTINGTVPNGAIAPKSIYHGGIVLPGSQVLRPVSDVSDGNWTTQVGGTSLYEVVDEATLDTSDYIQSEAL